MSSRTTTRSSPTSPSSRLSRVVLPAPARPATTMLCWSSTTPRSRSRRSAGTVPAASRSSQLGTTAGMRRRVRTGRSTSGGSRAWSRTPPGSTASAVGWPRSRRRPVGPSTRRTTSSIAPASWKATSARSSRPPRSTQTSSGPFTQTSVTCGSRNRASTGPRPATSSTRSRTSRAQACGASTTPSAASARATARRRAGRSAVPVATSSSTATRSRTARRRRVVGSVSWVEVSVEVDAVGVTRGSCSAAPAGAVPMCW